MRQARRVLCLLLLLSTASVVHGCGGDDEKDKKVKGQRSTAGDSGGAEDAVRGYLAALIDHDGAEACDRLAPEYQKSVLAQNREFARQSGAKDCASLIDAVTKRSPRVTFEGQPLNDKTVDKIKLVVTVRLNGEEQNATVTGAQGLQRYELRTQDDKWWIFEITQAGG